MNPLDSAAAESRWAAVSVTEKVLALAGLLILVLIVPPWPVLPVVLAVVYAAAFMARVPWRLYAGLVLAPLGFIALGLWPLMINITTHGLVLVDGGVEHAIVVAARSLAGMSVTMLYAITTPISAQLTWAHRVGVPEALVAVTMHMYRFSSLLYRQSIAMWNAQARRLGHSSFRRFIRSAADQAANLFVLSFHRARKLQEGLELRADLNATAVYGSFTPARATHLIGIALLLAALAVLGALEGGFGF